MANAFLEKHFEPEYNSAKHAMRSHIGGFSFKMQVPGGDADQWHTLAESDFGSTFREASLIDGTAHSYDILHVSRAWVPQQFVDALKLIAWSVQNVASSLLIAAGSSPTEVRFSTPVSRDSFAAPWRERPAIAHLTMPEGIEPSAIREQSANEIRQRYDRG